MNSEAQTIEAHEYPEKKKKGAKLNKARLRLHTILATISFLGLTLLLFGEPILMLGDGAVGMSLFGLILMLVMGWAYVPLLWLLTIIAIPLIVYATAHASVALVSRLMQTMHYWRSHREYHY